MTMKIVSRNGFTPLKNAQRQSAWLRLPIGNLSLTGFTLVEILVAMTVTMILSILLIQNFSNSRGDVKNTAALIRSTLREAQTMALASVQTNSVHRCGYGVHFEASTFLVFAGPNSASDGCAGYGRIYQAGDTIVRTLALSSGVSMTTSMSDVYFEPPLPTTYIQGVSTPGTTGSILLQQSSGTSITINVSNSGAIE